MLTIRKIRVASDDWAAARRTADYVLDVGSSAGAVSRAMNRGDGELAGEGEGGGSSALWLGSPRMLERLGVEPRSEIAAKQLARVLQGRHASSGERVRTEGLIQRDVLDEKGRPVYDENGRRQTVRVRGTKCVDLTFSAPKSVSVVWSQSGPRLRAEIESAMVAGADAMLENMTQAKAVVAQHGKLWPAQGFAAAAALHVMARAAHGEPVPSPQLHVHGVVVGVERTDGFFASPELSGMFKYGAPLEGGAVARARLAERLVELGFEIVREGRFFEIRGVPGNLTARMSGRTRDVEARVSEREVAKGKPLTARERAVAALETRMPKSKEASLVDAVEAWAAQAAECDFDRAAIDTLRLDSEGFTATLAERRKSVSAAVGRRLRGNGAVKSIGDARATILECAAGRLRLDEALSVVEEMAS